MGFHSYRVCFIIQIVIAVCESARPLNFSLYTSKHTWNEANDVCLKHNKAMLSLKSLSKNNVTIDIATKWINSSYLVSNFWISLIECDYGEFQWSDCEPLEYSNWDENEPGSGMCVGFNITYNKWQTFSCNEEFQVVCEEEAVVEKCWFEEYKEVRFSETDGLIGYGGHSLSLCQNRCLELISETTECIMVSFEFSTGVCRLLDQAVVRVEGTPPAYSSPTFNTYVKRCYDYYVAGDEIVILNKLDYPETNCTEDINTTSSLLYDSSEYITTSIIDYSSLVTTIFDIANQTPLITESVESAIFTSPSEIISTEMSEAISTSPSEAISTSPSEVIFSLPSEDIFSSSSVIVPPTSAEILKPTSISTSTSGPTSMPKLNSKPVVPTNILCPCKCFATVALDNGTKEEEIIAEIKKELFVNTTTLSSFKRKLYSAEDSRSSAEVVGSIAIGFLGALLLFVAILDFHHFLRGVQNIFLRYRNSEMCAAYQAKAVEDNKS